MAPRIDERLVRQAGDHSRLVPTDEACHARSPRADAACAGARVRLGYQISLSGRPTVPNVMVTVDETRTARPRRITRQPKPRPPHPLGAPQRSLSTNTGPLASAAWLAERAVLPGQPKWFVEIRFLAKDDPSTCFQLDIYAEEWGFQFQRDGRSSWIRVTDTPFVHGRDDFDLRDRAQSLRDIGGLIRWIDEQVGVHLERDAPGIRSNIAHAYAPVRAWIATL
jgi:hypothetical protein